MDEQVIAYDIDGVLTHCAFKDYEEDYMDSSKIVGVVTSRSEKSMEKFMEENLVFADFAESARLKSIKLRELKKEYDADRYIYIGSWIKDRAAAKLAGWEYYQYE